MSPSATRAASRAWLIFDLSNMGDCSQIGLSTVSDGLSPLESKQAAMRQRHRLPSKRCTKCRIQQPLSQFALRYEKHRPAGSRKSECRQCRNSRAKGSKIGRRQWLNQYLSGHPCVDCGETDIDVLEFDHRDPATKVGMVTRMGGLEKREAEAAKCDVRCANCHRRRHARDRKGEQPWSILSLLSQSQPQVAQAS